MFEDALCNKLIHSVLVIALLNMMGCYSTHYIPVDELNRVEDLGDVEIITSDSVYYSFEQYSNTKRMFNAPEKYYYEYWSVGSDTLSVLSYSFDKLDIISGYQLKKDTLVIPFSDMEEIIIYELNTTNTLLLIATPIVFVGIFLIAMYKAGWI